VLTEDDAQELCLAICGHLKMSAEDAAVVTSHLVDAELRGTVGLSRLLALVNDARLYGLEPTGVITTIREGSWGALVDGGNRSGIVVAEHATQLAIAKARAGGIAAVAANNHRFSGLLSYYVEACARAGLVALAVAAGGVRKGLPRVAPYAAAVGRFTTNPIAFGFPTVGDPIVWDIATSASSGAELLERLATGVPLRDGTAIDSAGKPTVDAHKALDGALLTWGGHRGSGLAISVHLLAMLAGLPPFPTDTDGASFLIIALDPSVLGDLETFKEQATAVADRIRATPPAEGHAEVRMPYDRSLRERSRKRRDGVELSSAIHERLMAVARDGIHAGERTAR